MAQVSASTPQTLGFLFMAVAGLVVSIVILQVRSSGVDTPLGRPAAYVGIVGFLAALANYISWLLAPAVAAVVMPINGLLWFTWWIMVSVSLFKLAKDVTRQKRIATVTSGSVERSNQ